MANTASAKKNVRKNEIRRVRNSSRRSAVKTAIKRLYVSLEAKAAQTDIAQLKDAVDTYNNRTEK